jgi:E3 ubiquitin-protein ligase UHRF1
MDPYELERQRIIQENQALLESLGLGPAKPLASQSTTPKKTAPKRPRLNTTPSRSSSRLSRQASVSAASETAASQSVRRSSRVTVKETVYSTHRLKYRTSDGEFITPSKIDIKIDASIRAYRDRSLGHFIADDSEDESSKGPGGTGKGVALGRKYDPKRFGNIPGVPVGRVWDMRTGCSMDSIHAPLVACISGNPHVGAWSICFSGGYEDNLDAGETFTLTGAGGRDLKGNGKNLRTAPQSFDQSFEHNMNGALLTSSKTGKPVRVVRGYKTSSDYAPLEGKRNLTSSPTPGLFLQSPELITISITGYRYDGLYKVTSATLKKSPKTKFKVCIFTFVRLPNQPRIPLRSDEVMGNTTEDVVEDLLDPQSDDCLLI